MFPICVNVYKFTNGLRMIMNDGPILLLFYTYLDKRQVYLYLTADVSYTDIVAIHHYDNDIFISAGSLTHCRYFINQYDNVLNKTLHEMTFFLNSELILTIPSNKYFTP